MNHLNRNLWRKLGIIFGILIGGIIAGAVMLTLVFSLPQAPIAKRVVASAAVFEREGAYPQLIESQLHTVLDNFTDALMLMNAAGPKTDNTVSDALSVNRLGYGDKNPSQSLIAYSHGETADHVDGYPRYWHGYLVILKPLLSVVRYQYIRQINIGLQLLLFTAMIALLVKRKKEVLILPFAVAVFSLFPPALAMSMQYSTMFYLGCSAMIFLLLRSKIRDERLFAFFLILGMLTSYLDFLTYPVFTLGMPLALWLFLTDESNGKTLLRHFAQYCVMWALGYVGMWAGKWILATIFTDTDVLANAWQALVFRSSHGYGTEEFSILGTYKNNLNVLFKSRGFDIILALSVIGIVYKRWKSAKSHSRSLSLTPTPKVMLLVAVALMPFVWYAGTVNHSSIHIFFTFREMAVTVFAGLAALGLALKKRD